MKYSFGDTISLVKNTKQPIVFDETILENEVFYFLILRGNFCIYKKDNYAYTSITVYPPDVSFLDTNEDYSYRVYIENKKDHTRRVEKDGKLILLEN